MKTNRREQLIITLAMSVPMLAAAVIDSATGKAGMAFYAISAILCFFILYALLSVLDRNLEGWKTVICDIFMITAIYLSNRFDLYHRFWFFDIVLHSFSGLIIAIVLPAIFLSDKSRKSMSTLELAFISFVFAVAAAGFWEIIEFFFDLITGSDVQRNLIREREIFSSQWQNPGILDTMNDIINGTAGGLIGSILIYISERLKKED